MRQHTSGEDQLTDMQKHKEEGRRARELQERPGKGIARLPWCSHVWGCALHQVGKTTKEKGGTSFSVEQLGLLSACVSCHTATHRRTAHTETHRHTQTQTLTHA